MSHVYRNNADCTLLGTLGPKGSLQLLFIPQGMSSVMKLNSSPSHAMIRLHNEWLLNNVSASREHALDLELFDS